MTPRRLLIVSHVRHYDVDGRIHAYGPYAREIEIWADLFPEVVIACPVGHGAPPADALPMHRPNITVWPITETGGETLGAKLWQIVCLPAIVSSLIRAARAADAVHVRCPGNLGLLGVIITPLMGKPRVAKFAGQWNGYRGEPWSGRLQRYLLRTYWRAPVTVYGEWPGQPPHVVPFFTSMMTDDQVRTAAEAAESKIVGRPLRVLFAGRLAPEKRVPALIEAVKLAIDRGTELEVVLLGDGPERNRLRAAVTAHGLDDVVRFVGALPFDRALEWYRWAHCLVLPSVHSEGWPKVIAEAMCHGVLCVAVDHGQIRSMLEGRGVVLTSGEPAVIAEALVEIASDPGRFRDRSLDASRWARQHSLEGLREAIARLLTERWQVGVPMAEAPR